MFYQQVSSTTFQSSVRNLHQKDFLVPSTKTVLHKTRLSGPQYQDCASQNKTFWSPVPRLCFTKQDFLDSPPKRLSGSQYQDCVLYKQDCVLSKARLFAPIKRHQNCPLEARLCLPNRDIWPPKRRLYMLAKTKLVSQHTLHFTSRIADSTEALAQKQCAEQLSDD